MIRVSYCFRRLYSQKERINRNQMYSRCCNSQNHRAKNSYSTRCYGIFRSNHSHNPNFVPFSNPLLPFLYSDRYENIPSSTPFTDTLRHFGLRNCQSLSKKFSSRFLDTIEDSILDPSNKNCQETWYCVHDIATQLNLKPYVKPALPSSASTLTSGKSQAVLLSIALQSLFMNHRDLNEALGLLSFLETQNLLNPSRVHLGAILSLAYLERNGLLHPNGVNSLPHDWFSHARIMEKVAVDGCLILLRELIFRPPMPIPLLSDFDSTQLAKELHELVHCRKTSIPTFRSHDPFQEILRPELIVVGMLREMTTDRAKRRMMGNILHPTLPASPRHLGACVAEHIDYAVNHSVHSGLADFLLRFQGCWEREQL